MNSAGARLWLSLNPHLLGHTAMTVDQVVHGHSSMLAILIPVLRRPQNVLPLVTSIQEHTPEPFTLLFISSPGDTLEIKELIKLDQQFIVMSFGFENRGDYARKINEGFRNIEATWYFTGADDLRFYPLWFENAMKVHEETGALVIGTNDLGNPRVKAGHHSTHSLVHKDYVLNYGTIDERGKVLHEGYPHEFVDDEFVATAQKRKMFGFTSESIVEHLHPNWGKAPIDALYIKQPMRMRMGRSLYQRRQRLWM